MKNQLVLILIMVSAALSATYEVTTFNSGQDAYVNSYIIDNQNIIVIIDTQYSSRDAQTLADVVEAKGRDVQYIISTHGHPDHFFGLSALHSRFPDATILVATEKLKNDIIGFANFMVQIGDIPDEMMPKSDKNPNGFDYEDLIEVLDGDKLELSGGGTLKAEAWYQPGEADHESSWYLEEYNAIFMGDLCFNKNNLWLGTGVNKSETQFWKTDLNIMKDYYGYNNQDIKVYCGHGPAPIGYEVFQSDISYIENFDDIMRVSNTKEDAKSSLNYDYSSWTDNYLISSNVDAQWDFYSLEKSNGLRIRTWNKGTTTFVNSHIIINDEAIAIIDCQDDIDSAKKLATYVKSLTDKNQDVAYIIVTHGHPDHYFGLGTLRKEFPDATIYVASEDIKNDILGFTQFSLSSNQSVPENMIPKSDSNTNGFDYQNWIKIISNNKLDLQGGGTFEVQSDFPPLDAPHESNWFLKELNALFTGDVGFYYNFLYLGPGVNRTQINNWKKTLEDLRNQYEKDNYNVNVYSGHGHSPSNVLIFRYMIQYIDDFEKYIANYDTKEDFVNKMLELYPKWAGT